MKLILCLTLVFALPSFADETFSTRLISTSVESTDLPNDLSFKADKIHIVDPIWFTSIFSSKGCEDSLDEKDLNLPIEILSTGPRSIGLFLGGKPSSQFSEARSSHIPLHYQNGQPVHPHYMVKLKNWILLQVVIHRNGARKHLKISAVRIGQQGEGNFLRPILEADGH